MEIHVIDPAPRYTAPIREIPAEPPFGPLPRNAARRFLSELAADDRLLGTEIAEGICLIVASAYGITGRQLLSESRTVGIAFPRQVAMTLIREELHFSLVATGAVFSRDHGTVIHAIKTVAARSSQDPDTSARLDSIREQTRRFIRTAVTKPSEQ